jgi:hypothetical protein
MSSPPPAYLLAKSQKDALDLAFSQIKNDLAKLNRRNTVNAVKAFLSNARPAINMNVAGCARLLETGEYLNVYEISEREALAQGVTPDEILRARLGAWYSVRVEIDQLFRFDKSTHYGYANLGGIGPNRYGDVCIILDTALLEPYGTAFSGDSIRSLCDSLGKRVISDSDALKKFGLAEDIPALATVKHAERFKTFEVGIDMSELSELIEGEDSLMEIHIHAAIKRENIAGIVMMRKKFRWYGDLVSRANDTPTPWPREFDPVIPFTKFVQLIGTHEIPFFLK